jgi:hypothetical protein
LTQTDFSQQAKTPAPITGEVSLMVSMSHICLAIPVSEASLNPNNENITLTLSSEDLSLPIKQWDEFFSCTLPYKVQYNSDKENKDPYLCTAELVRKEVFNDKIVLHMFKKQIL